MTSRPTWNSGGRPAPGNELDLLAFLQSLARDWRGWPDVRQRRSEDAATRIDARHDGAGRVRLTVTLQDDRPASDALSASITLSVEAGDRSA